MRKPVALFLCITLCILTACTKGEDPSVPGPVPPVEDAAEPGEEAAAVEAGAPYQHGRTFLGESARTVYDLIWQSAFDYDLSPVALPADLSSAEAERLIEYFLDDNPRFYWLVPSLDGRTIRLEVAEHVVDLATARERQREIDEEAAALLNGIAGDDFAVMVQIHDRLALHTVYQSNVFPDDTVTIYGGLVNTTVICDGYAKTYQYLLQERGIPCIYIRGVNVLGIPHAWNAVLLDDAWVYVDLTQNDKNPLRHDYMNMTLEECEREHTRNLSQYPSLPPAGDSTEYDYYIRSGWAVRDGRVDEVVDAIARAVADQLVHKVSEPNNRAYFTEFKVDGTQAEYEHVKEVFLQNPYIILDRVDGYLREEAPHMQVGSQQQLTCNYNDTMRILIYWPVVYPR